MTIKHLGKLLLPSSPGSVSDQDISHPHTSTDVPSSCFGHPLQTNSLGEVMRGAEAWVGNVSSCCCSLFLLPSFSWSFLFAHLLCSSLGPPQFAVPHRCPCSGVGHPWLWDLRGVPALFQVTHGPQPPLPLLQSISPAESAFFQEGSSVSSPVSPFTCSLYRHLACPFASSSQASSHLLSYLIWFLLSHLLMSFTEGPGPLWLVTFRTQKTLHQRLWWSWGSLFAFQLPWLLLFICTEPSISAAVTPALRSSEKIHFGEHKTKAVHCIGSDHRVHQKEIFSMTPPSQAFPATETILCWDGGKIILRLGDAIFFLLVYPARELVDGHVPQHSFPESESTSTNWSSFKIAPPRRDCRSS